MKYLFLIKAALWRKPLRSVLTVLAIMVAFLMFGVMHGVVSSFDSALDKMSDTRLRTMSRASFLETLPIAHRDRIAAVDGITVVSPFAIFIGYYQAPTNPMYAAALDVESFLNVMPEIRVPQEQLDVLRRTRTGAVVGAGLAERHGWKIGDRVPLKSQLWMNSETGEDWFFDVVAIANGEPGDDEIFAQEMYFHYEYLDEGRASGKNRVNQFIVGIDDPGSAVGISEEVDALFANSSDETSTVNEKQWVQGQLSSVGDIQSFVYYVLGAVLFTLFFLTGTNMMQSLRERIPELGILKSLGFSGITLFALVVSESIVLCLAGAVLGLVLAGGIFPGVFATFGVSAFPLGGDVYLLGLVIALTLALLGSLWPAWRAMNLDIVNAIGGY